MENLLAAGTLEPVLSVYEPSAVALSMLLAFVQAGVVRVRLLADFLAGAVGNIPGLRSATTARTFAAGTEPGIVGP